MQVSPSPGLAPAGVKESLCDGTPVLLLLQTAVLAFGVTYLLSRKRTVNRRPQIQTKKEMKPVKGCFCLFGGCPSQGFPGVPCPQVACRLCLALARI